MLRSAANKVAWVGRTASMVFGLALVMALLFGVASTALGANGGSFILGKANNVATRVTGLIGKVATGEALVVKNPSGGSALGLSVGDPLAAPATKTVAPMKVDSRAVVGNLNADKLDGQEASKLAEPPGYAHVKLEGDIDTSYPRKGINDIIPTGETSLYCFDLTFPPRGFGPQGLQGSSLQPLSLFTQPRRRNLLRSLCPTLGIVAKHSPHRGDF